MAIKCKNKRVVGNLEKWQLFNKGKLSTLKTRKGREERGRKDREEEGRWRKRKKEEGREDEGKGGKECRKEG